MVTLFLLSKRCLAGGSLLLCNSIEALALRPASQPRTTFVVVPMAQYFWAGQAAAMMQGFRSAY